MGRDFSSCIILLLHILCSIRKCLYKQHFFSDPHPSCCKSNGHDASYCDYKVHYQSALLVPTPMTSYRIGFYGALLLGERSLQGCVGAMMRKKMVLYSHGIVMHDMIMTVNAIAMPLLLTL